MPKLLAMTAAIVVSTLCLAARALAQCPSGWTAGFEVPSVTGKWQTVYALDVLDDLKIGLLSGNFDASTVSRLRDAAANLKSTSGDPGLDSVLSEIELRVEVELAKAGQF